MEATAHLREAEMRRVAVLALVLAALVVANPVAATAHGINDDADEYSEVYAHSTGETIAAHDLGAMDAPLELYDDSGTVTELNATYNESQQAPFGVRWDKVDAAAYRLFPRVDGETDNGATWTATAQWSTSSGANSGMTITDADAHGVQKVSFDASVASGETATATFGGSNVSLDDPNKRVLQTVLNVDTLASGATVEVRAVDGDGDYRAATIDTADTPGTDETSIANATGNGYVMQETVSDLPLTGAGDGTLDSMETVEIVVSDANAKVTVAGFDLDKKSTDEFATIARDTDGDGEDEAVTFEDYWEGGGSRLTEYSFGSEFSNAVIHDWTVYEVRYPLSAISDSDEVTSEFRDNSSSSYGNELEVTADIEVPEYIDLTHGTLSLRVDQALLSEKYGTLETAIVSDDTDLGNTSDSAFIDRTGSLGSAGDTVTLVSGLSADQQYRVHYVQYLTDSDANALMMTVSGGPTGSGGGFFSTLFGKITGVVGAVVGAIGLGRVFGSGES